MAHRWKLPEVRAGDWPNRWCPARGGGEGAAVSHGDAAARLGVSIKGGLALVTGTCGYMAGFMGQKGTIIVCGDTGAALADSMYETVRHVGGNIADLGNDAISVDMSDDDSAFLETTIGEILPLKFGDPKFNVRSFKKIVAGR